MMKPVIYVAQPKVDVVNIGSLIRLKAEEYGLDSQLVASIIECESGGHFDAINTNRNGSTDKGLLQINSIHEVGELDMFDPEDNLEFGLAMMKESGTTPWNASKHCWKPTSTS